MANYCIVAPPQILRHMKEHGRLGPYHLLLAHDVVKPHNAPIYNALFYRNPNMKVVILDNSVAELGTAVDIGMVVEAARIVSPTVTVLPDVYLDGFATVKSCKDALGTMGDHFDKAGLAQRFLYIPQGKTFREFAYSAMALAADDSRIKWWGVPRNVVPYHGSRLKALQLVKALNPNRKIHLMGFSDDMVDDVVCARHEYADTIDSAVPLRFKERFNLHTDPGKRGDWWEQGQATPLMYENLECVRKMLTGSGVPVWWRINQLEA